MTVVSRSIPGLFGGVSQKIPALRHPTQGSVQDNGLATLVDGLYKRPGTRHIATLDLTRTGGLTVANTGGNVHSHVIDRGDAGRHQLLISNGSLMLYDLTTGASQQVDNLQGFAYLNAADPQSSFRCVTVADTTFIVNTSVTPQLDTPVTPARPTNVAYINVRTVYAKVTFKVTVNGQTASYTATDTPTNAEVASGLRTAIQAMGGFTAVVLADTNIIKVTTTNGTVTATTWDGWGNTGLQNLSAGVDKYSDLPARMEPGYPISVRGDSAVNANAYWVVYDGTKWIETTAPGVQTTILASTMPHKLRPRGDGTWVFEQAGPWEVRKVGDDNTNPVPSFIGRPIRSIFFHRNRLGFLCGDRVVLSRAGSYYAFWSQTAQQVLDTDPIDLTASHEMVSRLEWAVGYNEDLLVFAQGPYQFVLVGGDLLTPKNARLVPTTTYATDASTKPAQLGNKVLFTAPLGSYSQVNLYRPADDRRSNTADDLTDDVPAYIPAGVRAIAASTTVKAAAFVPSGMTRELVLLKYDHPEGDDKWSQRAWQKVILDRAEKVRIVGAYWVSKTLYLTLYTQRSMDNSSAGHFAIEALDFDPLADPFGMGFGLRLDRQVRLFKGGFSSGSSWVDVPYPVEQLPAVLRARPGLEPEELPVQSASPVSATSTRLFFAGDIGASPVVVGQKFAFTYEFTEPFMVDREGTPLMASELKHVRTLLRYVDTGFFLAEVSIPLRSTYSYPFSGRTTGQPGQGASQLALSSGTWNIPVQAKAAGVKVRIKSDSYFPCTFPFAEWVGDVTVKAQR